MASITSKELSALEDQLNCEQVLVKKYYTFASQCVDPQLTTKCEQVAARHQDHFNRLMTHLS
jgi:hypothetical protein